MIFQPLVSPVVLVLFAVLWVALTLLTVRARAPRRLALGALIGLILAGPSIPGEELEMTSNVEIYLAVDRTGSMAAEDWEDGQPRLAGVARDIVELVDDTAGARYAILTWDSTARLELPVTTDSSAVDSFAQVLHQELAEFSAGSSLSRPADLLLATLADAAESRPENKRFLVVFTDGEETDPEDFSPAWAQIANLIDGGAVLGYGTEGGGPMRTYPDGEYITDEEGNQELSYLDPATLEQLADTLGVPLLLNPTSLDQLDFMAEAQQIQDERNQQQTYRYLVWPLALGAGVLLLFELRVLARDWRANVR